MIDARELKFVNAFNSIPNVGAVTLRNIKKHFFSFEEAWRAPETAFAEIKMDSPTRQSLYLKRPSINPDRELEKLFKEKIWLISEEDAKFPNILKEIPSPPLLLYGRGNADILKKLVIRKLEGDEASLSVGVVGTRKPTAYGQEVTEKIVRELCAAGITISSGLASGIDTKAHETALKNKGQTIAVLGCGVNHNSIFPPENKNLVKQITEAGGTVISEYSPDTPAVREHFPQRNRIISGLSAGVLVIEARERSGALITANFALEQNREVFAIPGSIFSLASHGPNNLIKEGGKLVSSATDILEELGLAHTKDIADREKNSGGRLPDSLSNEEKIILEILEEPLGVDLIKNKTKMEVPLIISTLSMLELKGHVRNVGEDNYQKK